MVGIEGFEPPTLRVETVCAVQLRHTPMLYKNGGESGYCALAVQPLQGRLCTYTLSIFKKLIFLRKRTND
jgi:hypothetical protein